MRQVIISLLGLLIIAGAVFISKKMGEKEKPRPKKEAKKVLTVFTETVKNSSTPIKVTASGNLAARDRIEIFAEVQGIFEGSDKRFDPGMYFEEDAVLLRINSDEHRANLRAQKSSLYNQLVTLLPDLRFDYPDAFQKWENYVNNFDVERTLQALPQTNSDKEKLFIVGRNINATWYTIKNLEERLSKYTIYAPFNGILIDAAVDKGALIRAGQRLGEFINPSIYELEVAVNSTYMDLLKVGNSVTLHNVERTKKWSGKVSRINSLINPSTQTAQVFIRVNGKGLREGMYLEADLTAKQEANTYELSRKLLFDNNKIYTVPDSTLEALTIEPIFFKENTVVVRGIKDGTRILSKPVPSAYEGMPVQLFEE